MAVLGEDEFRCEQGQNAEHHARMSKVSSFHFGICDFGGRKIAWIDFTLIFNQHLAMASGDSCREIGKPLQRFGSKAVETATFA